MVRQRQPRIEYPTHLAYVRTLPCQICKRPGSEAAHLRTPAPHHGKRDLGMQEKADDCWVLPLCHFHHMQQHDRGDELAWWASYGIDDPHALAIDLFAKSPSAPKPRQKRERRTPPRKPPEQRRSIPKGPPLKSANRLPGKGQMKFPRRSREGLT